MAYFDLLAREHAAGRIPDNVFSDIGMGDVLAKYLGEKAASNILAVMRQPLAAAGIKLRQEVFLDLEKPEVLEYLSALKLMLQDLENRYNTYHYQRHPFYKATAFYPLRNSTLLSSKLPAAGCRKPLPQACSGISAPVLPQSRLHWSISGSRQMGKS